MPAKWRRVNLPATETGLIQVVQAKKHTTVFRRSPRAPNAGRKDVKDAFRVCAKDTLGEPDRAKRTAKVQACMKAANKKTGVIIKKSRAKGTSPLHGTALKYTGAGTPERIKV